MTFEFGYLPKELQVDETVTELDIPLTKDPRFNTRIKGKIVTNTGEPAQGMVYFQSDARNLGIGVYGDGSFDQVMEANVYEVYAITDQGRSDEESVALAEGEIREVTLVVKSDGRLTGIIEGLADGETASLEIDAEVEGFGSRHVQGTREWRFCCTGNRNWRICPDSYND